MTLFLALALILGGLLMGGGIVGYYYTRRYQGLGEQITAVADAAAASIRGAKRDQIVEIAKELEAEGKWPRAFRICPGMNINDLTDEQLIDWRWWLRPREVRNCLTCGTGRNLWMPRGRHYICPTCEGDPLKGNGRADWKDWSRAGFIKQFGPRREGDAELYERYKGVLP